MVMVGVTGLVGLGLATSGFEEQATMKKQRVTAPNTGAIRYTLMSYPPHGFFLHGGIHLNR